MKYKQHWRELNDCYSTASLAIIYKFLIIRYTVTTL